MSWIFAQIRLDQISFVSIKSKYYNFSSSSLIKHYLWLSCVWTEGFNFIHPCHSSLHCVGTQTVIDNDWPTYLLRENCLSNRTEITREILIQITDWIDLDNSSKSFVRQMTQLVTLVANNSQLRQLRENFEQNYSLQSQLSNSQFRYGSFVVISFSFTTISVVSSLSFCCWYCFNG